MNTTSNIAAVAASEDIIEAALQDVARFIRRNGLLLDGLFEQLGDDVGAEAVINLIAICSNPLPPHRSVAMELQKVMLALEGVSVLQLDDMVASGRVRLDVYGAVRWSGAATTDLYRRIALT